MVSFLPTDCGVWPAKIDYNAFAKNISAAFHADLWYGVLLQGGRTQNDTLNQLYNRFYTHLPTAESEHEIENCHRQLIARLEKTERKLVLRIMDAQNLITEERLLDSFLCGFKLAWKLAHELDHLAIEDKKLYRNSMI